MIHDNDIDLRQEMKELIAKTNYQVLLQKTSKKIRCSCFNEKYKEAQAKCPKCLGTGWLFRFEKYKTFIQDYASSPENAILFTELGKLSHGYKYFYFEHNVVPQVGDYIWEVVWQNTKPVKLRTLYKIKGVSEQRGETGRIEYKVCVAQKEVLDKDFKNMYIGKAWRDV